MDMDMDMEITKEIPYGYCECGCGRKTNIAKQNNKRYGWVKGEPKRFLRGHNSRGKQPHERDW